MIDGRDNTGGWMVDGTGTGMGEQREGREAVRMRVRTTTDRHRRGCPDESLQVVCSGHQTDGV